MKKVVVSLCIILLSASLSRAGQDVEISLKNNTEKEIQKKNQLERLLKQYHLSKWIFTRKVLIDEQTAIPHSHPVLTLNTGQLDNDLAVLSSFIHEQIHWLEESKPEQREKAIAELKAIYPDAPSGPPQGARNSYSTYLHLIVCHLEYEAMRELVGDEKAKQVIETTSKYYYGWIYRTVLSDGPKIKAVVERNKLGI
jgi:hypothetical protein